MTGETGSPPRTPEKETSAFCGPMDSQWVGQEEGKSQSVSSEAPGKESSECRHLV